MTRTRRYHRITARLTPGAKKDGRSTRMDQPSGFGRRARVVCKPFPKARQGQRDI